MSIPYPRFTGSEPCRSIDPEVFFMKPPGSPQVRKMLRALCGACDLRNECAEYAIRHELHGFWGGMTATERREYRQRYGITLETLGSAA